MMTSILAQMPRGTAVCAFVLGLAALASEGQVAGSFSVQKTPDGQRLRLSWQSGLADWILKSNRGLDPGGWTVVSQRPILEADTYALEVPIEGGSQKFFRLESQVIIFVDDSNALPGDGSFSNPYRTISAAIAEAKSRYRALGRPQVIYVFEGDYAEGIVLDGSGIPGLDISLLDSSVAISLGGDLIGGGERARVAPPAGQRGIDVQEVSRFAVTGFEVTSSGAVGIQVSGVDRFGADGTKLVASGGASGIRLAEIESASVRLASVEILGTGGAGIDIAQVGGHFEIDDRSDETFVDTRVEGTGGGAAGIDISDSTGVFRFADLAISGTGTHGIRLERAGRVELFAGCIDGTGGDGINSENTDLKSEFLAVGLNAPVAGDGFEIVNSDGIDRILDSSTDSVFGAGGAGWKILSSGAGTLSASLVAPFSVETDTSSVHVRSGVAVDSLRFALWGFSFTAGSGFLAVDVRGGAAGSLITTQFEQGQITSNLGNAGGAMFEQVTFDRAPDTPGIQAVVGGGGPGLDGEVLFGTHVVPNVPAEVQRLPGDVLSFINTSGEIRFSVLDIGGIDGAAIKANNTEIDANFVLGVEAGTIDVNRGPALELNDLAVDLNFSHLRCRNSPSSGVIAERVDGSIRVTDSFIVANPAGPATRISNSPGLTLSQP